MTMKKVMILVYDLDRDLLKYLREENVEVVALLQGVSDEVPSFSIYDLFYSTEKLPFNVYASKPIHLSDAFMCRYLDCISRVSFVPMTEEYNTVHMGTVRADNVVDWAQFHAQTMLQLLLHYAPDEIWLFNKPHLGIDNILVEIGKQLGLPVLTFQQSMMAGKFFYERSCDKSASLELEFTAPTTGAFKANLFYMKQFDTMPVIERLMDRSEFYMKAPVGGLYCSQDSKNSFRHTDRSGSRFQATFSGGI